MPHILIGLVAHMLRFSSFGDQQSVIQESLISGAINNKIKKLTPALGLCCFKDISKVMCKKKKKVTVGSV